MVIFHSPWKLTTSELHPLTKMRKPFFYFPPGGKSIGKAPGNAMVFQTGENVN